MISSAKFKELTDYIIALGAAEIAHTNKSYLAHAIGVYNDMKAWEASDDLCYAALFHSIYGTQGFQDFTLSLDRRPELCDLIGDYAEKLAFVNCYMDRSTMDAQVREDKEEYPIRNRVTGEMMSLNKQEYEDLLTLHLCDLLEQVERSAAWNVRRSAYRGMAERLGGIALTSYDQVFEREPNAV